MKTRVTVAGIAIMTILSWGINLFAAQGEQIAIPKSSDANLFGYYEYLPLGYDDNPTKKFPIVIFWHGLGECGDGTTQLSKVLYHGPPKNIKNGTHYPAIVISPQTTSWPSYSSLDTFVEYVFTKYGARIDRNRVYMTGLSMGGRNTWGYAQKYPQKLAAIVPVCGASNPGSLDVSGMVNMGVWAFHNLNDGTVAVSCTYNWINAIKAAGGDPLMTIYPVGGHDAWTVTYNDQNMWNWLFAQTQLTSGIEIAGFAANPASITNGQAATVQFSANITDDGSITKAELDLSSLSGSSTATMTKSGDTFSLSHTIPAGAVIGTRTIVLTVTDNDSNTEQSELQVEILPEPGVENDLTKLGDIIATVTAPKGGGNHNIEVIRDGDKPAEGNTDSSRQYDTYDGNAAPFEEYIGYTFATQYEFRRFVFQEGKHFYDGGFYENASLKVQVRQNGTWNDVNTMISKPYPNGTASADFGTTYETYTFTLDNVVGDGIRLIGNAGGSAHFISVGELEVFGAAIDETPTEYALTVNAGSGDGSYEAGATVTITADVAPTGKEFNVWTGDTAGIADVNSASTTLIMPAGAVTISATYKDLPPVNQAPAANAGTDQSIVMPETASLFGSASDDGLPNGNLSYAWSKVSGPGSVNFSDATEKDTVVDFSEAGTYVLKLTVSDSELSASDTVTVTVAPEPQEPPTEGDYRVLVDFGAPTAETVGNWNNISGEDGALNGSVADLIDTDANQTGISLAVTDAIAGVNSSGTTAVNTPNFPATATGDSFWGCDKAYAGETEPTAELTLTGLDPDAKCTLSFYASRMSTSDNRETEYKVTGQTAETVYLNPANNVDGMVSTGQIQADANGMIKIAIKKGPNNNNSYGFYYIGALQLDVEAADIQNAAPTVDAGADQEITLPATVTVKGTVSDDGLPSDGVINYFWTKVSGPGNVTFDDATAIETTASFDAYGTYVLQLSADDGELSTADTLTVVVNPEPHTVLIDCGSTSTAGNWNNLQGDASAANGSLNNLIDSNGANTGVAVQVTDAFSATNANGTSAANAPGYPAAATQDSFWGSELAYAGHTEPTAAVTLTNLDPNREYVLTFYASRMNVSDNRETEYKVAGASTSTVYLNAANNVDSQVTAGAVRPDANGKITVSVKKGPNNTNHYGFYYLGVMKIDY